MAKIVDPDLLSKDVSVIFNIDTASDRRISLADKTVSASSNIEATITGSDTGVTMQALYSFFKELWKADETLIKTPFPLISITKTQFDFVNSWNLSDLTSKYLIRDAGWSVRSGSNNVSTEEWVGIVTLGSLVSTDQPYYQQSASTEPAVDFQMPGNINQSIQHFEISSYNKRLFTKLFVREWEKTFDDASIQSDLGVVTQEYTVYSLPLTNATDLKITEATESAVTGSPYTDVTIEFLSGSGFASYATGSTYGSSSVIYDANSASAANWWITYSGSTTTEAVSAGAPEINNQTAGALWEIYSGSRDVGGINYAYNIIVNAGGTKSNTSAQIYTRAQYELRLNSEIDDSTPKQIAIVKTGKTTDLLMLFLGDTLQTSNGVWIENFQDADTNSIEFFDVSGSTRTFPFVSTGTIAFNSNLISDASAEYFMFYTSPTASGEFDYGTSGAIIVNDNLGALITGSVVGSSSVSFTFDYDNNTQGGRTGATPANVTVVAIGLSTAQYVLSTGTIARTKTNTITLVSALERNYSNPA